MGNTRAIVGAFAEKIKRIEKDAADAAKSSVKMELVLGGGVSGYLWAWLNSTAMVPAVGIGLLVGSSLACAADAFFSCRRKTAEIPLDDENALREVVVQRP